jgi:hypothetical protein
MKIALITLLLLVSACSTQRIQLAGEHRTYPSYEGRDHFFLLGLGQWKKVRATDACESSQAVEAFETYYSVGDVVFLLLTMGLYTPRSYAVYCALE